MLSEVEASELFESSLSHSWHDAWSCSGLGGPVAHGEHTNTQINTLKADLNTTTNKPLFDHKVVVVQNNRTSNIFIIYLFIFSYFQEKNLIFKTYYDIGSTFKKHSKTSQRSFSSQDI